MTKRRARSLSDKVKILLRFARCPRCGGGLTDGVEWDHIHALALGGADTNDNFQPLCLPCHRAKSSGLPATTRGSDIQEIARTRRLTAQEKTFRAKLLAKGTAFLPSDHIDATLEAARARPRPKRKIPSRPFPRRDRRAGN